MYNNGDQLVCKTFIIERLQLDLVRILTGEIKTGD